MTRYRCPCCILSKRDKKDEGKQNADQFIKDNLIDNGFDIHY